MTKMLAGIILIIAVLLVTMVSGQLPSDNIVVYYPFDSNANDLMNRHDGSVSGATLSTGIIGNGYDFDGSNDCITLSTPDLYSNQSNFSVVMWVNPNQQVPSDDYRLFDWDGGNEGFYIGIATSRTIQAWLHTDGEQTGSNSYPATGWTMITWVFNNSDASNNAVVGYFVNDTYDEFDNFDAATPSYVTIPPTPSNAYIGCNEGSGRYFNGTIDEVSVWNISLTGQNVSDLWNDYINGVRPYKEIFVSNDGDDSNDGLTTDTPIATIDHLNSINLFPSDRVYFNKGDAWRVETDAILTMTSGSSDGIIFYGAYGSGALPIFYGSHNLSNTANWTESSSNWWHNPLADDVGIIVYDDEDSVGIRVESVSDLGTQGEWHYNESTNNLTIYSTSNPASHYDYIEVGVQQPGQEMMFNFDDLSYIQVSNWSVRYHGYGAFNGENMVNVTWSYNDIRYMGGAMQTHDPNVRYGNCMDVQLNATNILIEYNNVTQCFDGAITVQAFSSGGSANVDNVEVRYNKLTNSFYPLEYFNSRADSVANNINIHHNTFALAGNNSEYGSRFDQTIKVSQVRLSRTPAATTNFIFQDNIIYTEKDYAIYMGSGSNSNWKGELTMDYNLYYNISNNVKFHFNGTEYGSLSALQSAYPNYEANGDEDDPLFTNLLNGNYQPLGNSPACSMSSTGSFVGAFNCSAVDASVPRIYDVYVSVNNQSANITWETNETANGTVDYGITVNLGLQATNTSSLTSHLIILTGLNHNTMYYYNITSCDGSGNCNYTGDYNFVTDKNIVSEGFDAEEELKMLAMSILMVGFMFFCVHVGNNINTQAEDGKTIPINTMVKLVLYSMAAFTSFMAIQTAFGIAMVEGYGQAIESSLRTTYSLVIYLGILLIFLILFGVSGNLGIKAVNWIKSRFDPRKARIKK